QFEGVLDMLAGRYPSDEFGGLRARLVWDRTAGTVRARDDARRLAVLSGGTIPDRGLYGVFLADGGQRVGELDEEMVYEARQGEVFQLGASSWRIEQITRDRVLVSPAPGVPGKMPFWKGDAVGRPFELGRAVGEALRTRRFGDLDPLAAANLAAYLDDQRRSTGVLPSDRTIVVERFRDELGDWRICLLSPFGGRVHAPWALAIEARLSNSLGIEVEAMWGDDGIVIRLPDADAPPPTDLLVVPAGELDDLLVDRVTASPLFAARFRENAARALLLPRRRPGRRTPLWQQRLKAHDLQQVALRYGSFPILLETFREVLSDVFEVPALRGLLAAIGRGEVRLVEVETAVPSPFANSLMFDYVAAHLYEGDAPAAERRAQALSLDRALLAELLTVGELRELLDPDAIAEVAAALQGRRGHTADHAHDQLRRVGDLAPDALLRELVARGRAVRIRLAGRERVVALEDAGLYRDGAGVSLPAGLPQVFLEPVADALTALLRRHARVHPPFTRAEVERRFGVDCDHPLGRLVAAGELLEGAFLPGGDGLELVAPEVLARIRRRTLANLRREIEPVDRAALGRFLPAWHGIGHDLGGGPQRLREVVSQLQGVALPPGTWESDVLPVRLPGYREAWLDELCAGGDAVWVGSAGERVTVFLRDDVALLAEPVEPPDHPIVDALRARGAVFFGDLAATTELPERVLLADLWELVWAGAVTNDSWHPLRGRRTLRALPAASAGGGTRRARPTSGLPAARGRWSLVADLPAASGDPRERVRALAETLLHRHGVVTRAGVVGEGVSGGFGAVYPQLRAMEESGACRRGYFIDGLGGAQFALAVAVERLRDLREPAVGGDAVVLSAADPANPYGTLVPWPQAARRPARVAGAWVVLVDGAAALYVERGGRGLVTLDGALLEPAVAALRSLVESGRAARLAPERIDGEPIGGHRVESILLAAGFLQGHRKLVLRR
ncbi:MAG TPA: hypothetical protein VMU66_06320, partial [Gaiellales bacterium]|nr:hypothetical protein [Gaiellales bacterium]